VVYRKVKAKVDGLAVGDAHAIVVTSTTPSELTLLHELAHFIGGMDHGPEFQRLYRGLVARQHSPAIAHKLTQLLNLDNTRSNRLQHEHLATLCLSLFCSDPFRAGDEVGAPLGY
jgi:hypothetical protein